MQIDDLLKGMHRLSDKERCDIGSYIEEWARETVNARLTSTRWEKTTVVQDTKLKQDWTTKTPSGKPMYAQFKGRLTGNDILVCMYQPFFGFGDKRNEVGRDMQYDNIHYYVTYPPMANHILVSNAKDVKSYCNKLEQEFIDRDGSFPFYSRKQSDPQDPNKRERPSCCQLRYKIEEGKGYRKGQAKVLAFLPPHLVSPRKLEVDPEDFRAYLSERLKPRQVYFEFA